MSTSGPNAPFGRCHVNTNSRHVVKASGWNLAVFISMVLLFDMFSAIFLDIENNWKTWFAPPPCVSTSDQRKFGSFFEILNTPPIVCYLLTLTKVELNFREMF